MKTSHCSRLGVTVSLAALLAIPDLGYAQVLEEITVTAQKREENLQDVGIAVTAFSGDQIEALGFQNTTDIVFQTPGLQLYEFSPSITVYNIRGVSQNSFSDNLEGPVAIYIDDAYVSALGAQNQPLFDVERVEILKGPQGTLYGRNATGGLIKYVSRKPGDELDIRASASFGDYGYHEIEAAIGGPLSDTVRGRFAIVDTQEDGYLQSDQTGIRDAYGKNATAIKAFLDIDIGDSTTLSINPYWSEDKDVPTGGYARRDAIQDPVTGLAIATAEPARPFFHSSDVQGRFDREITGASATLKFDFDNGLEFTSITNFYEMEKFYSEDTDGLPVTIGDIFGNPPFGPGSEPFAPLGVFAFDTNQDFEQFSQEIRISSDTAWGNWQAGIFYLDISEDNFAIVEGLAAVWFDPATGGLTQKSVSDFSLDADSISVFYQGEFDLTDRVTLIVGGRYVEDDKEFETFIRYEQADGTVLARGDDGEVQGIYGPTADGSLISPICYSTQVDARCAGDTADPDANFSYSDWAGKVQLDFSLSDDTLLYFGINRGTKGGNWAAPGFVDSARLNGLSALAHTEETLWSYEAGVKTALLGGRGRLNAAVFHYDYDDYQAFSLINFVQNITNNDATVTGAEFEFSFSPTDRLDVLFGGSLLDSEVKGIFTPFGVSVDTELPSAPSVSLNALVRYARPIGNNGELSAQIDANYNGEYFLEVTNPGSAKEDAYTVANLRLGYVVSDNFDISAWVRNVTDEEYRIYSLDVAGAPVPFINDVYARPRTYGVTLTYRY